MGSKPVQLHSFLHRLNLNFYFLPRIRIHTIFLRHQNHMTKKYTKSIGPSMLTACAKAVGNIQVSPALHLSLSK